MDFRNYDASIGRFFNIDVLSELHQSQTPYNFSGNNPVYYSDPSGLDWYSKTDDDGNLTYQWFDGSDDMDGYNRIGASFNTYLSGREGYTNGEIAFNNNGTYTVSYYENAEKIDGVEAGTYDSNSGDMFNQTIKPRSLFTELFRDKPQSFYHTYSFNGGRPYEEGSNNPFYRKGFDNLIGINWDDFQQYSPLQKSNKVVDQIKDLIGAFNLGQSLGGISLDRKKEARVINMQIVDSVIHNYRPVFGAYEGSIMEDTTFNGTTADSIRVSRDSRSKASEAGKVKYIWK